LTLLAIPGARLVLRLMFETAWFSAAEIECLLDQLRALLEGMCANPDAPVARLPLLSTAEEDAVLRQWQGPAVQWTGPATVVELIESVVAQQPDAVAVVAAETGATLTYGALNRAANQVAWKLRAAGVRPEGRVGVWVARSLELVVALVGVLKAGAVYVPLDPAYPSARLATMVRDAGLQRILTGDGLPPVPGGEEIPVQRVRAVADGPAQAPTGGRSAEHAVSLLYTSGSTGRPKGVVTTQAGLANRLRWMQETYRLTAADRVLQKTPVSFDVAGWELFWPLTAGAQMVLLAPGVAESAKVAATLRRMDVTVCHFVPSLLRLLVAEAGAEAQGAPLRLVVCSGEALTGADVASGAALWPGAAVENLYGPTEASIDVTRGPGTTASGAVPLGRPISNTQVYVCDASGQATAVGVPGELYLGGVGLARGYWGQPAATAARFVPDPWGMGARLYRTGDRGWWRADGELVYGGRRDGQVKVRGVRIEVGEVEAVVGAHPGVAACVAQVWGEQVVAYVVPRGADVPEIELRQWARVRLPEAMVPARFVAQTRLPRLPNGKVARAQLPAPDAVAPVTAPIAPRDPLELQLALIWEQSLRLPRSIGVGDSFYELGGNSMQALTVVARIDRDLGASIALADLTESPTVEQLAARLRDRASRRRSSLVTFRATGAGLPFFCMHPAGGNVACYAHLARELGGDYPFHGLQASGLDLQAALHTDIHEMAATYVDEIRRARPGRPYAIGGWSTGGLIAFEVAQRLIAVRETVALLVLFDARAPGDPVDEPGDVGDLAVPAIADVLGVPLDSLRSLDPDQQFDRLVQAARASNRLPPGVERAFARRLLEVFHANVRAARRYTATFFPGRIVLFASSDPSGTRPEQEPADMGWSRLALDVQVRRIVSTHRAMMNPPHVHAVADELRACLQQATQSQQQPVM
jgi:amino acid adenylation domain-containing protein